MLEPVAMADDWSLEVEAEAVASFWRLTSGAPLSECGMTAGCCSRSNKNGHIRGISRSGLATIFRGFVAN